MQLLSEFTLACAGLAAHLLFNEGTLALGAAAPELCGRLRAPQFTSGALAILLLDDGRGHTFKCFNTSFIVINCMRIETATAMPQSFQKIVRYAGHHGIIRPREIEAIGIPREYVLRLYRQGKLERAGRGLYMLPDAEITQHHSYAEVSKRVPDAVLCLLTALTFHEITTQNPAAVWIALRTGARTPMIGTPRLRIVRVSPRVLSEGIETHKIEGVPVRIYSVAKTVADCFKFRSKVGLDVAIEALKDALRQKKATPGEIYRYAKICRVAKVIQPYMEAL